ncbi:hypothetical protein SHIRM173S_04167 [Streptomyces hirsutus]
MSWIHRAAARLRSLVSKGFAPRHMEHMERRVQHVVDELLDRMTEHGFTRRPDGAWRAPCR